jgi:hypothetical protein
VRIVFDFVKDGEHLRNGQQAVGQIDIGETNVLMTCIRENYDRQICEECYRSRPVYHGDVSSIWEGVSLDEVEENQNDKIANCNESNNTGVLERVQSPQERKWNDN